MRLRKITFGDKEVDKKELYSSKRAISLDSVDLDKIVVSSKWKIIETNINNDTIQPLSIVLPQRNGYIK